jgi:hypothetical protein
MLGIRFMLEDGTSYAGSAKRCLASFVSNQGNNKAITKPVLQIDFLYNLCPCPRMMALDICSHIFE